MTLGKSELRAGLTASRKAMADGARSAFRAAVRDHVLDRARTTGWLCVAAYEPLRTEPGSTELLAGLAGLGVQVLVPLTLPDRDLEWVEWGHTDRLGLDAIGRAAAVLVPALAVARDGTRLGRGGGSYDRALRRCTPGTPRIALVFDDELVAELPRDDWDEPVHAVVRPAGWTDLGITHTT